jgi:proteasome assembly chaperone (PAC2) family protein
MKLREKPRLRKPILIAAWPGMGLVAYKSVSYLVEKLEPRPLGAIDPQDRFPIRAISISNGLVKSPSPPEGRFYYHTGLGEHDLLLFLGDEQPIDGKEWSMASELLADAEHLGASLLFTFAAMPCRIDHHSRPGVWGVATDRALLQRLREFGIRIMSEGSISGLNGVLLGAAKQRGWEGYCLLGEIPLYATQMESPKTCHRVLEQVCAMTGIEIDLEELMLQGEVTATQIDLIIQKLSQQENESDADIEDELPPN